MPCIHCISASPIMRPGSPFAWPGGKRALKKTLLALIPPHTIYAEVFAGSAKLLFAKNPSKLEVLNDVNGDLINFFRVAKHRPAELAELLETECIHAARFRELRAATPAADEVERALRFIYLVWHSFGAKGEHYASPSARSPQAKHSLDLVRGVLDATSGRLARVHVEQRDFAEILARYDSRTTFFYLDPPYVDFQPIAQYEPLSEERREEMFKLLAQIKGKFLMSFDDCAEIRGLARQHGFGVRSVGVVYTMNRKQERKKSPELLIANYSMTRAIPRH
jgi:DNA adenine methylase